MDKQSPLLNISPKSSPPLPRQAFSPITHQDKADIEFAEPPQKLQKMQDPQQSSHSVHEEPLSSVMNLEIPDQIGLIDIDEQLDWIKNDLLDSQHSHHDLHNQQTPGELKKSICVLLLCGFVKLKPCQLFYRL